MICAVLGVSKVLGLYQRCNQQNLLKDKYEEKEILLKGKEPKRICRVEDYVKDVAIKNEED